MESNLIDEYMIDIIFYTDMYIFKLRLNEFIIFTCMNSIFISASIWFVEFNICL